MKSQKRTGPETAQSPDGATAVMGPQPIFARIDGKPSMLGAHHRYRVLDWDGKGGRAIIAKRVNCPRCGGAGGADKWSHTGWTCYHCGGRGSWAEAHTYKLYSAEASAKLDSARAKRKATAAAKREAERQAELAAARAAFEGWKAEHAAELAKVEAIAHVSGYDWVFGWDNVLTIVECLEQGRAPARPWALESALKTAATIERLRAEAQVKAEAGWLGAVGDKIEVVLTVRTRVDRRLNEFPPIWSHFHVMETSAHETVVYRGSKVLGEKGDTFTIRASIKELDEYQGVKQTVIQRPKVIPVPPDAVPKVAPAA